VLLIINVAVAAGEGQRWPNELGKPRTPKATNQSYPHLHGRGFPTMESELQCVRPLFSFQQKGVLYNNNLKYATILGRD